MVIFFSLYKILQILGCWWRLYTWADGKEKKENQKKNIYIYKFGGNKIWRMANIFKFGGNIIWRMPEKRKFWRELNLADFYQIRQIRQIFFPPKFLPLRYVMLVQLWEVCLREPLATEVKAPIIGCCKQMSLLSFFFALCLGERIFMITDNLSKTLQKTKMYH